MAIIVKRDTNGVKGTLGIGEFGLDHYPAGGDAGRIYYGYGGSSVALSKKEEVDTASNAIGTVGDVKRYDKILGSMDIIATTKNGAGKLILVRYAGDDDTSAYFRDVLSYDVDNKLEEVKHYYGTTDLVTASAITTLGYTGSDLTSTSYTES